MSQTNKKKDERRRNYACIVYTDSAPQNWQEILADEKIPAFVSPIHDRDMDPQKQPKKPHYHVIVMFEGNKSEAQVREVFNKIAGVGLEAVNSIRGYARYLCHLDNPEKALYNTSDVKCFGGADYHATIQLATDIYHAIDEILYWCEETETFSFAKLIRYSHVHRYDWFRVLCDHTMLVKEYLRSERQDRIDAAEHIFPN